MTYTPEQIKGKIKNLSKKNNADARTLMRIYMMERFLERLSVSDYTDNFIIKGGILVTSMIGVAHRSTMDIDTSMKNLNLSAENAQRVIEQVANIDLNDGISFEIKEASNIMDEMEYPGIRISMTAFIDKLRTPLKIDISTGDAITPQEIAYKYDLLLEERSINLWSYNLETILAEKLQTILSRGILNTRMRDFYDVRMLLAGYREKIDIATLREAYIATCTKRSTEHLFEQENEIIETIENNNQLHLLWDAYRKKYAYASDIAYEEIITNVKELITLAG
nr:nucleotidyl transferase AbiEii/AbiGii toxin family protein [Bifidobacterium catenulatum]